MNPASAFPLTDAIRAGLPRATPADAQAVRDLTRAAYARWTGRRQPSGNGFVNRLAAQIDAPDEFWAASLYDGSERLGLSLI
jgi:hypothetical protein